MQTKRTTRWRRWLLGALLAATSTLGSGCMTIEHLIDPKQKMQMYGGTKSSYQYIEDPRMPRFGVLVRIIDLPFTAVADTLLLPISAPVESMN